ncbi:hypothetical protein [Actinoplanes sp. NPDC089786]|uniref:hypothetical protein n=1 Tax=Actinoplanes sp. NPDC089786 TaxID=3155185 RepID=UPI0034454FE8
MSPIELARPPVAITRMLSPVVLAMLRSPFGGPARRSMMALRFTGRKSGRRFDIPVSAHHSNGTLLALTAATWRVNFRGGHDVEVTYDGRTTPMRGELVEAIPVVADFYQQQIQKIGIKQAPRQLALKINVPRMPTAEELAEIVVRERLSILWLKPRDTSYAPSSRRDS